MTMQYKNGREAKNGDLVFLATSAGTPFVGVLYNDGRIAQVNIDSDLSPNMQDYLHLDDAIEHRPADVPPNFRGARK